MMKVFKCKKCGNENQEKIYVKYDKHSDMLEVNCQRCQFEWYEEPLDKKR